MPPIGYLPRPLHAILHSALWAITRIGWGARRELYVVCAVPIDLGPEHVRPEFSIGWVARRRERFVAKHKVICVGLGRTGTTSLKEVLRMLGYRTIHLPLNLTPADVCFRRGQIILLE